MTTFKDSAPAGADPHTWKMSLSEIFETLLGGNLSIRISAYDGSSAGPADASTAQP